MEEDFILLSPDDVIDDLEELEELRTKLSHLLCHLTNSNLSYTHYDLSTMIQYIEKYQEENIISYIKDDLMGMIKDGACIEDIESYLNGL